MVSPRMGSNLVHIRSANLSVVLDAVRRNGSISRAELTAHTLLTPSTITNLVNELLRWNLLVEVGSVPSSGGRNRTLLRVNDDSYRVVAIAIQPGVIHGALINLAGQIGWRRTIYMPENSTDETYEASSNQLYDETVEVAHNNGWHTVGVGIAGCCKAKEKANLWWQLSPLRVSIPVITRTDHAVRAAALAETWFGLGKGADSLVYLDWNSRHIGVVLGGELFTGAHGNVSPVLPDWCMEDLEVSLRAIASVYDPDVVIVHADNDLGKVTLLDEAKPVLLPSTTGTTRPMVYPATFGSDAALVGAACLVLNSFFSDPIGHLARLPIPPQWNMPVSY